MNVTTSISFFRFGPWHNRAWALAMMGAARLAMPRVPDIGFWKLCGSGTGEGFTPVPNTAVYAASKAAMNSFTRTAATELAPRKIRVNAVNPGTVFTPIFGKTGMPEEQLNGFAAAMQERVPLKRFGQPEDIAKLVAFLASDDASFITGGEYNIDGGININPLLAG